MRHRRRRWLLVLALSCLFHTAVARAQRAQDLFFGPELRVRPRHTLVDEPTYEIALPHGIATKEGTTAFVARVGVVLPSSSALAFPFTFGFRFVPFAWSVRPLVGAELGGYLAQGRGRRPPDTPSGPQWTWSARALLGAHVSLGHLIALRMYVDAEWAQAPEDGRLHEAVYGGLGAGAELQVTLSPPRFRLSDMFFRGTAAPEGF